ncbi:MAG: hypothetical protein JNK73_14915 [Bacteroidia bacterium]|nr:hypothetical protein [Bacteroidia bacterium]
MKKTIQKLAFVALASGLIAVSCKKDEKTNPPSPVPPPPANEEELITTFKLYLSDGSDTTVYLFKDPDGDGGIPAFYGPGTTTASTQSDSVIVLKPNTTYTATLVFLDESKTVTDTISHEIEEEADDHMVFFNQSNPSALPNASVTISGTNLGITYLDNDGSTPPLPLGLITKWQTGSTAGKAPLNMALKHQPGVKNGTYAPGDTDISVNFKVLIN